jgi:hypothetical protein
MPAAREARADRTFSVLNPEEFFDNVT